MTDSHSSQRSASSPIGVAYFVLLFLGVASWLSGLLGQMLTVDINQSRQFGWSGSLGFILGCLFVGRQLRRSGIGSLLITGSLIMAAAYAGEALSPSWGFVLAFEFVRNLGSGVVLTLITLHLMTRPSPHWLIWSAAFTAASGVPILLIRPEWRSSNFMAAALALVVVFLFVITLRRWGIAAVTEGKILPSLRHTLSIPRIWLTLILFTAVGAMTSVGIWPVLVGTIYAQRAMQPDAVRMWQWWVVITSILMPLFLGVLSQYANMKTLIWMSMGGILVGLVVMTARPLGDIDFLGMCLSNSLQNPLYFCLLMYVNQGFPPEHFPNAIAIQRVVFVVGTYIVSMLLGSSFSLDLFLIAAVITLAYTALVFSVNQRFSRLKNVDEGSLPLAGS